MSHSPSPEEREQERCPCGCDVPIGAPEYARLHGDNPATPPQDDAPETSERVEPETWTIYVCPDCGRVDGQGFDYEVAEETWCCEACDNFPVQARSVTVVPALALTEERERRQRAEKELEWRKRTYLNAQKDAAGQLDRSYKRRQRAEAEARTERKRREEAEEHDRISTEAFKNELRKGNGWAEANAERARAEAAEARLSTAQDALREIKQATYYDNAVGQLRKIERIVDAALPNPTPSERKGRHPATSPPQDREAGG